MNKNIIILILLLSCKTYAQNFLVDLDGVRIECSFQLKKNLLSKNILLVNKTENSIYFPTTKDTSLYYFVNENKSYSYIGVSYSMIGIPSLGGIVKLKEIESGDSLLIKLSIATKASIINEFHVGVDFVRHVDLQKRKMKNKAKNSFELRTEDYLKSMKYYSFDFDTF